MYSNWEDSGAKKFKERLENCCTENSALEKIIIASLLKSPGNTPHD